MQTILIDEKYTRWHRILGFLLEKLLTPLDLQVMTDHPIMSGPLQADVVIVRRETEFWTDAQRERMPDGIRDSLASDVILEFKYTESANRDAFQQALGYDITYRRKNEYEPDKVETFLLSSMTPEIITSEEFGYKLAEHPGVYRSTHPMMERVTLLVLNELSDVSYNAYVKIFSSRKDAKAKAQQVLTYDVMPTLSNELQFMVDQLIHLWFAKNIVEGEELMKTFKDYDTDAFTKEINMIVALRNEMVEREGLEPLIEALENNMLAALSTKKRLQGLSAHEIITVVHPENFITEFKPEFIAKQFKPEVIISQYKPEEVIAQYKPEELMKQLNPEDMVAYLQRLKESQGHDNDALNDDDACE